MSTMEITTMIGCPQLCTFCPQEELKSIYSKNEDKYLSLENFKKYLKKIPLKVSIHFSGMSEPWANPKATDMLEHTLKQGYTVAIYSTLVGMKEEDADRVVRLLKNFSIQIEKICLHLPDNNGNMRGYKPRDRYFEVLKKFIRLKDSAAVKQFEIMTMDGSGRFHSSLDNILKKSTNAFEAISRAGALSEDQINAEGIQTYKNAFSLSCAATPYYDHNVLLPNGDVALCCMDYELKHVLGNLKSMNYKDLYKSQTIKELKDINKTSEFSKCSICKSCSNVINHDKVSRFNRIVHHLKNKIRKKLPALTNSNTSII